jgi:hypothetical protein
MANWRRARRPSCNGCVVIPIEGDADGLSEKYCGFTVNRHPNTRGLRRGGGRPKGKPNKVTIEVRAVAEALVDDPVYRKKLQHDMRTRKVAPQIEALLWYYAKGKPKELVELTVFDAGRYSAMSDEELAVESAKTAAMARALVNQE